DPIRRYPEPAGPICTNPANIGGTGDQCATEISNWAFNTDLKTGAGWDEDQNIVTHAISFNAGGTTQAFMESIAAASGNGVDPAEGEHYVANNAATLVAAFASIITQAAQSIEYTYSSPVIPFNPDDAAVSGEFLYVPMFEPEAEKFWKGNLKKYRLTTNSDGDLEIKDSNTADVVDDAYEFVSSTDLWSTSADGGEPLVGGVAQHKTGTRVLYTYLAGVANQDLTNGVNRVRDINANITEAMLGAGSPAERKTVLDWASREDGHVGEMGAPIHSKPVVVSYSSGNDLVLIPTSEGVLEAFDAETGHEVWGFIPEVLLQELEALRVNADSVVPTYGLDGPITTYKSGSSTYVVVGMRRGGKDYYALDITNRDAPEFAWSIMSTDSDFTDLAQTWSKPLFVRMDIGVAYNADADGDGTNDSTDVLVFAGGYDEDQDNETSRVADDEGNAIYIVNPRTGALIKDISNSGADINISDMTNSIASDLLTVDINANGIIDRLYAADVGGRIIRVDLPDSKFYDTTLSGGIVADINEGVSGGYRRFFNTPEVGYYNQGGEQYLSIMIGSGFRPEPADTTVTDRFYMMKDTAVWRAPGTDTNGDGSIDSFNYVTVTTDELNDVSNSAISGPSGWYFNFTGSEKSFSKAKLYNYVVMFTTYAGEARDDTSVCTAAFTPGEARFYAVDMRDASAVFADMDPSGGDDPTIDDRSRVLNFKGIPPSPSLVFPASGSDEESVVKAIVGLEEVAEWPDRFHAVYWEEVVE
ncbi:MAG: hypothetical protein GY814_04955, partial [Gammaproteobacteria bacterium]|nr:hypothetical protein [Gammaproteobacteria bacterium]